jgi:hypothetical protein
MSTLSIPTPPPSWLLKSSYKILPPLRCWVLLVKPKCLTSSRVRIEWLSLIVFLSLLLSFDNSSSPLYYVKRTSPNKRLTNLLEIPIVLVMALSLEDDT